MKKLGIIAACLIVGLAVLVIISKREIRPGKLGYTPAGSDDDAKDLVAKLLQINKPWLQPAGLPATYSYSLHRRYAGYFLNRLPQREESDSGPFLIAPGCSPPVRVGSIVETPLHAMVRDPTGYTSRMVGLTTWGRQKVVAVDVIFASPVRCAVGMGGQSNTSYSSSSYQVKQARILIDPVRAVPVLILSSTAGSAQTADYGATWEFADGYLEINGGLAPRAFNWNDTRAFRERQEFQVVNGLWLFKNGQATWRNPVFGFQTSPWETIRSWSRASQQLELVNLRLENDRANSLTNDPTQPTGGDRLAEATNRTPSTAGAPP